MNEKPIIFSGQRVRAILEGRKTQTRRVVKPASNQKWLTHEILCGSPSVTVFEQWAQFAHPLGGPLTCVRIPLPVGTRLWVRETYGTRTDLFHVEYQADRQEPIGLPFEHIYDEQTRWRSSMFMPRRLSRIDLLVTDVRCQRLQEITEEDAIAEGAAPWPHNPEQPMTSGELGSASPFRSGFACLWDDINAARGYTWFSNPWVWAYTFQVERGDA